MDPEDLLGSDNDFPELGGRDEAGDDRSGDSPDSGDPDDETDRDRPGEYPESDESDDDRELDAVDDEDDLDLDDADEDEDEDLDLRRGRHPSRSMESIAKEERRRRLKTERRMADVLEQVVASNQQIAQLLGNTLRPAAPAVPDEPPVRYTELEALRAEGKFEEAAAAQEKIDTWRDAKNRETWERQSAHQASVAKLGSILKDGLNFEGDKHYAMAVRARAKRLQSEIAGLPEDQANLVAAAIVGREGFRGKTKDRDPREESRRREEARRRPVRRSADGRLPEDRPGATVRMSKEMRAGLARFGQLDKYVEMAKTPEGRKTLAQKIRRLDARMKEASAEARRGGR